MKMKIMAILIAIAMIGAITQIAEAGTSDTLAVSMTPSGTADILVYNTSIGSGDATWVTTGAMSAYTNTTATKYTLKNNGVVPVNVNAYVSDDGAAWTLASTPGNNQFNMSYTLTGTTWTLFTLSSAAFKSNLPPVTSNTQTFGLKTYWPTSTSSMATQNIVVTFLATVV
jgi:hypothetical protein